MKSCSKRACDLYNKCTTGTSDLSGSLGKRWYFVLLLPELRPKEQNSGIGAYHDGKRTCLSDHKPQGKRDGLLTWYRVKFNLPVQEKGIWVPWRALINASGTGYIWLNGHNLGRYWEEGPQREFYLPDCWLKFGAENTLVIGLRQSEKFGALLESMEILPYYEDAEYRMEN